MTKVCVCGEFVEKTTSNSIKSVQNGKTSSGDICTRFRKAEGLPWQSSGYDSMLLLPRAHVRSLVEELNMPNARWHSQKNQMSGTREKLASRRQEGPPSPTPRKKSRLKG